MTELYDTAASHSATGVVMVNRVPASGWG